MNFSVTKKKFKKSWCVEIAGAFLFFCAFLIPVLFHTLEASDAPSIENLALSYTYIDGTPHFTVSGEVVSSLPGASITYGLLIQRTNFGEVGPHFTVTNDFSQVTNGSFSITLAHPTTAHLNQTSATNVRIRLTVTDAEGVSVTFDSASLSVLDIPPETPSITITAPTLDEVATSNTVIAFTATSGDKECRINSEPFVLCEKNITTLGDIVNFENLSSGVHTLTVRFAAHADVFATSSFTVLPPPDTTPPEVIETTPENEEEQISVTTAVMVTFSEPPLIDEENISFTDSSGGEVPVAFNVEGTVMTITPHDNLQGGVRYTITLSLITDSAGNEMEEYVFSFLTEITESPVVSSGGARSAYDPPEPILPPPIYTLSEEGTTDAAEEAPVEPVAEEVEESQGALSSAPPSTPRAPEYPLVERATPSLSSLPQAVTTSLPTASIPIVSSVGLVHAPVSDIEAPAPLPSAEILMAGAGAVSLPEVTPFFAGILFTLCGLGLLSLMVLVSHSRRRFV